MITKFNLWNDPQVGDYIICHDKNVGILDEFLSSNIGQCVEIQNYPEPGLPYKVQYSSSLIIKGNLQHFFKKSSIDTMTRWISSVEIIFFSSSREECEAYLASKKYNI
jgi:hypothetical protein